MAPLLSLLPQSSAVSTPTAVMQAQAAAFELVFAIQGPFLLAIVCLAVFLRRPGMRGLSYVYGCLSLATLSSALSVLTLLSSGYTAWHDLTLAVAMASVAAMWMFSRRALIALGGAPLSLVGTTWPIVIMSALSIAVVLTFPHLPFTGVAAVLFKTAAPRPLILALMAAAAFDAWQASRRTAQGSRAMQLVALAYLAMVVRQCYAIFASLGAFTGVTINTQSVTLVQIATTALNGVAFLAALMLEERDAVQAQAERMRATEMRLARTQRMESLGQMAGGIAHDFANLLTAISGGVSAAQLTAKDPEAEEHLQHASEAVERAASLTRQLSLFARQRPPEIVVFSVSQQLRAMEPMLRRLLGSSKTLVVDAVEATGAHVRMDVSQFEQIVLNLVVNARDAMAARGEVQVVARAMASDEFAPSVMIDRPDAPFDVPLVVIEVRDTGTGIAAADLERIFEPYFSTKGDRGTGLGLATVKSVVRAAGGAIGVSSTLDVGTTFSVALPQETVRAGVA
jgi:signal transduction histidine kinase